MDNESGEGVVIVLGRPSLAEPADQIAAAAAVLACRLADSPFPPGTAARPMSMAPSTSAVLLGFFRDGSHWRKVAAGSPSFGARSPTDVGLDTAEMLEAAAAGELRTLVLLGADPLSDFPDRDLATRALEQVEFLVSVDTILNASSMLADVVLPAAGFAERAGTTTNIEGRVSRDLPPRSCLPGVARADWVIATELADRLGSRPRF